VTRRGVSRALDRLWQLVSLYVPLVLVAVLAAGVYWLVENTPVPPQPAMDRSKRLDPDYFMRGVSLQKFHADGTPMARLWGDEARHYPSTGALEIDRPRVHAVGETGQVLVATAQSGHSNADYSELKLHGDARIVRQADAGCLQWPRLELRSDFLHVYVNEQRVVTDRPAELLRDDARISANRLELDHRAGTARFDGKVRTHLPAQAQAALPPCPPQADDATPTDAPPRTAPDAAAAG